MLDTLLTLPEGKTLEFKRDLSSPKPLLRTLAAFANTAGGRPVIGVENDRQVTGVEDPLAEEERLCNLIADSIAPRLVPQRLPEKWPKAGTDLRAVRENGVRMSDLDMTCQPLMGGFIRFPFAGPLRRTVPAIFQPVSNIELVTVDGKVAKPGSEPGSEPGSRLANTVIESLAEGSFGKIEIARALGHQTVSGELKKQIRRLLDLRLIEMTLPQKTQSRLQKYRLTAQGRSLLEK